MAVSIAPSRRTPTPKGQQRQEVYTGSPANAVFYTEVAALDRGPLSPASQLPSWLRGSFCLFVLELLFPPQFPLIALQGSWQSSLCRTGHISTCTMKASGSSWWTGSTAPCIYSSRFRESRICSPISSATFPWGWTDWLWLWRHSPKVTQWYGWKKTEQETDELCWRWSG